MGVNVKKLNVVRLKNSTLQEIIRLFMDKIKDDSENTYKNYSRTYDDFFSFVLGKSIENLIWDDILSIEYANTLQYVEYLKKIKKNSGKTIEQKIAHLKALWKELGKHNYDTNARVLDIPKQKEKRNLDEIGADIFTEQEIDILFEFAEQHEFQPMIQRLFFEFALVTALRKENLFSVRWGDIKQKQDENTGNSYWTVIVNTKNGWKYCPLTDEFYDRLCELKWIIHKDKGLCNKEEHPVFVISPDRIMKTIEEFKKKYGIDKKLSFHSFRKTATKLGLDIAEGDIGKVQLLTGHHSIAMVMHYRRKALGLSDNPGLNIVGGNRISDEDREKLMQFDKDQLIDILLKCGNKVVKEILKYS